MGKSSSKKKPEPESKPEPEPPLLDEPWVQMNWGNRENDLQFINNYRPQVEGQLIRILLHGPVGAGKSSFINSVYSVFQGRVCLRALVNNKSQGSFTMKYKTYRIPKGEEEFYPVVFNDMMGLDSGNREKGQIHVKDLKKAMKGHIKENYMFNPECSLPKDNFYYNAAPDANDKVHILVCVIDANTAHLLSDEDLETLRDIRHAAKDLGIPQVAILTKTDEACAEIQKDTRNIYKSRLMKENIQLLSQQVGIPESCIFPVKNYHSERDLNNDMDAIILNTLKRIIEITDDSLKNN